MTSKEHISEILKENIKLFVEFKTKRNLTERWNLENARAKDYHGRELLELLQNVMHMKSYVNKIVQSEVEK